MKLAMTICLLASTVVAVDLKLLVSPEGAKIDTDQKAKTVATQSGIKNRVFDLKAEESPCAVFLFKTGFLVKGFAERGDRIWQVHFTDFGKAVTRIAWVNAETGVVKFLFLEKEKMNSPNKVPENIGTNAPNSQH